MSRNRGAANVGLTWVIILVVLLVSMAGFGFLQMQQNARLEEENASLRASFQSERAERVKETDQLTDLSKTVGFAGTGASGLTSIPALQTRLEALANKFPSLKPDSPPKSLEEALGPISSDFDTLLSANNKLKGEVAQLRGDLEARQKEMQSTVQDKDGTISKLRSEMEDTRTSLNTRIADLERERDALRDQQRDLDGRLTALRAQFDAERHQLQAENQLTHQRNDILSEQLNGLRKEADKPDGSILSVSPALRVAWIDLGRLDLIRNGMEFEVRDPVRGITKGRVRVRRLQDHRAEVDIVQEADPYNPISSSDPILNALYSPDRKPVAVLLGDGFGQYSEADMRAMLGELGITVRSKVDEQTDYLILGTPFFDEDTREMVPWGNKDAYKEAESLSVKIIPMRDLIGWLGI
ncbi:MAG: hypothetical protein ACE5H3_08765 [Planctomycetota bacterium]